MPILISVILPFFTEDKSLDFAVRSVINQSHTDWELLLTYDGSVNDIPSNILDWVVKETRIRLFPAYGQNGFDAGRNQAIKSARGDFVVYLDPVDEFNPDYLERVASFSTKADLLIFGYDFVIDQPSSSADLPKGEESVVASWEPHRIKENLFSKPIAALLGIAHRRELFEKIGGFNELLWEGEEWDFLKRLVRMGVEPLFVEAKSGRRHVQTAGSNHRPRITPNQRESIESNRLAGKPLFGGRPKKAWLNPVKRIDFASPHSLIDFYNGAAIATSQALQLLNKQGFDCEAFCGSRLDTPGESLVEELLAQQGYSYEVRKAKIADYETRMIFTRQSEVPVTLFGSASTQGQWLDEAEVTAFLRAFAIFLDKNRPDAVLTYGGDPISLTMIDLAKNRDIPVVFMLHNCEYRVTDPFKSVDYVTVPSEFCRQFYWKTLGLACHRLPNIIDFKRVQVADRKPQYVTFVNPHPTKGLFVFARIAAELARRRPDIPLLVVEGRSQAKMLEQTGLDPASFKNLHYLPNTPDPRQFYAVSKLLLMPSLWNESFGMVAVEAMLNGIPVLGSNRGGLPEAIGQGGFVFDIPACYTPQTKTVPTAEEVEPWVETIIRLWDDAAFYEQASQNALEEAKKWHPSQMASLYKDFFSNIFHQPAAPLVPLKEWQTSESLEETPTGTSLSVTEMKLPESRVPGMKNAEPNTALENQHVSPAIEDMSREQAEALLTAARHRGDRMDEASALTDLGVLALEQSDNPRAVAYLENALGLAQALGDRVREIDILPHLGLAALRIKQPQKAHAYLERALNLARETGDRFAEKFALERLGTVYATGGNLPMALRLLEEALAIAHGLGDRKHESDLLWHIAIRQAESGQRTQALSSGQAAIQLLESADNPEASVYREHLERYKQGESLLPAYDATNGFSQNVVLTSQTTTASTPRDRKGPSYLRMAVSAAKALTRFVGSGMKTVSPETLEMRLKQCAACSHHTGLRCRICGCFTNLKARLPHEQCPIGQWPGQANGLED